MNVPHSDALVFFGAMGDLAYKKIFPSLQAMINTATSTCLLSEWLKQVGISILSCSQLFSVPRQS